MNTAPNFASQIAPRSPGASVAVRKPATLSAVLSTTLPVKPSVTTTSQVPLNRSRPSTLPMKFRWPARRSSGSVSCTSSLPLLSSSPIDSSPTRGVGDGRAGSARSTEPMCANWTRYEALALGVRAHVEHHRALAGVREEGGEGRARDAFEPPEAEQRSRDHRAGVAGAEDRVDLPLLVDLGEHAERGLRLAPDRGRGLLGHLDALGRVRRPRSGDLRRAGASACARISVSSPTSDDAKVAGHLAAGQHRALGDRGGPKSPPIASIPMRGKLRHADARAATSLRAAERSLRRRSSRSSRTRDAVASGCCSDCTSAAPGRLSFQRVRRFLPRVLE